MRVTRGHTGARGEHRVVEGDVPDTPQARDVVGTHEDDDLAAGQQI